MYLIIDEGNTRIKMAVFNKKKLIEIKLTSIDFFIESYKELTLHYSFSAAILSSVTDRVLNLYDELQLESKFILSSNTILPFKNLYETPKTLGVDRLALTTGAYIKYPNTNCLIIDAGTCITYDFINNKGVYLGGAISPGIQMRFNAMAHFTKKLPLLTANEQPIDVLGKSTKESMLSGVLNGMVFEIEGAIKRYQQKFDKLNIILTGGDANFLCKPLKNSIFVNPNFLLEGLNEVLTYQLQYETKFK